MTDGTLANILYLIIGIVVGWFLGTWAEFRLWFGAIGGRKQ